LLVLSQEVAAMKEAAVRKEIVDLTQDILSLPTDPAQKSTSKGMYLAEPPVDKSTIEEVLEILRLQVKYVIFDLEATRRENRYLRQMLEARPPKDRERGEGEPPSY
jgi:hypothetical protein